MQVVPLKLPTRPRDSKARMTGPRFDLEIFINKSLARDEVSVEEQGHITAVQACEKQFCGKIFSGATPSHRRPIYRLRLKSSF